MQTPRSAKRRLWIVAALLLFLAGPAAATHVSDETVDDVAAQLRCVVCQNLSGRLGV